MRMVCKSTCTSGPFGMPHLARELTVVSSDAQKQKQREGTYLWNRETAAGAHKKKENKEIRVLFLTQNQLIHFINKG